MRQIRWVAPLLAACVLGLTACGGDDGNDTTSTQAAKTPGIDPASIADAKGSVTLCAPALTVQAAKAAVKQAATASSGLTVQVITLPDAADEQNAQFVRRQRAQSGECDVFESDVVWTAQFAAQNWLMDVTDYVDTRKDEFIPSTLETASYQGRYYGVPEKTDAGLIYYRTDRVKTAPATWQELYDTAKSVGGFVYQGKAYEGLTVNFLEVAYAAGGTVISDDGKTSQIDSPENLAALKLMVEGFKTGAVPKAVLTFQEGETQTAFDTGKPGFMRNWPYAYSIEKASKTKGLKDNFDVAPLPEFEGAGRAGVLGGSNLVISRYSKHASVALKLVDLLTKPEAMVLRATKYSLAPVLTATYEDPDVKKALPFSDELKSAVEQAKSRPVSPVYTLISQAIYKNVNAALSGGLPAADAIKKADGEINKALATF